MIKDLFLAIILGALLGFGLTGGFFAMNKSKSNPIHKTTAQEELTPAPDQNQASDTSFNSEDSPSPTPQVEVSDSDLKLTIDTPENESISSVAKISIKGSTAAGSTVIVTTPVNTYQQLTQNGNFSIEVDLETGANDITVAAVDKDDNQTQKKLLVTYSTAKI